MSESLGSMYSFMIYTIMFLVTFALVLMMIDGYFFFGGLYSIRDGLDEGDYTVFNRQVSEFNVCPDPENAVAGTNCSGVISYEPDTRIVTYQISYSGRFINVDASSTSPLEYYVSI